MTFNLSCHASPTQIEHAKHGLLENAFAHLRLSLATVGEDNRHFLNLEAEFPSRVFHLDLEGITYELDTVEVDGLEHLARVAHEACRGIAHLHTGDETNVS